MDDIKGWIALVGLVISLGTTVLGLPYVRRKVAAESAKAAADAVKAAAEADKAKVDASRADLDFAAEMREMARNAVAEVRAEAAAKAAEQDARITAQDIVIVQCTELVDSFRAYTLTLLQRWPRCAVLPTCDLPPPPPPPSTLGLSWPPR